MSSRIDRDVLGACKGPVAECSGAVPKASLSRMLNPYVNMFRFFIICNGSFLGRLVYLYTAHICFDYIF